MHDARRTQIVATRGPITNWHTKGFGGSPRRLDGDAAMVPIMPAEALTRGLLVGGDPTHTPGARQQERARVTNGAVEEGPSLRQSLAAPRRSRSESVSSGMRPRPTSSTTSTTWAVRWPATPRATTDKTPPCVSLRTTAQAARASKGSVGSSTGVRHRGVQTHRRRLAPHKVRRAAESASGWGSTPLSASRADPKRVPKLAPACLRTDARQGQSRCRKVSATPQWGHPRRPKTQRQPRRQAPLYRGPRSDVEGALTTSYGASPHPRQQRDGGQRAAPIPTLPTTTKRNARRLRKPPT